MSIRYAEPATVSISSSAGTLSRIAEGLDEWVPDVRVRRFSEASHWVQCDVPERVNDELVAFLDEK